jgi:hypothetical protein
MSRGVLILLVVALASPAAVTDASPPRPTVPWQMEGHWDEGFAEVARYEGRMRIDEHVLEVDLELVTRVVHLWPDTFTEVDPESARGRTVEALKTTWTRNVPLGLSPRREQLVSHLVRSNLTPIRMVATTVDWHATTYKTWAAPLARLRFFAEDETLGEGEHLLALSERMVFLDDLPNRLRGLSRVQEGRWEIDLVETLVRADAPPPRVVPALVTVAETENIQIPAGRFSARRVTVTRHGPDDEQRVDTLWFDRQAPYRLLWWEQADGYAFRLLSVQRVATIAVDGPGRKVPEEPETGEAETPGDEAPAPAEGDAGGDDADGDDAAGETAVKAAD